MNLTVGDIERSKQRDNMQRARSTNRGPIGYWPIYVIIGVSVLLLLWFLPKVLPKVTALVSTHDHAEHVQNKEEYTAMIGALALKVSELEQLIASTESNVQTDVVALPPPEPEPVETAALRYVVNTDSTNVRAGNNTSTKIITTLKKGESVVVIGVDEESGWYKTTGKIIDSDSGVTVQQWKGGHVGFVSHKLLEVE